MTTNTFTLTRGPFWGFMVLAAVGYTIVAGLTGTGSFADIMIPFGIYMAVQVYIALGRVHDIGFASGYAWLILIPFAVVVLGILPSKTPKVKMWMDEYGDHMGSYGGSE